MFCTTTKYTTRRDVILCLANSIAGCFLGDELSGSKLVRVIDALDIDIKNPIQVVGLEVQNLIYLGDAGIGDKTRLS